MKQKYVTAPRESFIHPHLLPFICKGDAEANGRLLVIFILLINMLMSKVSGVARLHNSSAKAEVARLTQRTDRDANSIRAEMRANYHNCKSEVFVSTPASLARKFNPKFADTFSFV